MVASNSLPWIRERLAAHHPRRLDGRGQQRAAVAVTFRAAGSADDSELLLIKRAERDGDPWSGHMAFPGGRLEPSTDGDPLAAALREAREEVALELGRDARLLGPLDEINAAARGRRLPLIISPFAFELLRPVELRANEEVEEIHWVPLSRLRDERAASTMPYQLEGMRLTLPCLRVARRVIWGLTYQMLMRLYIALDWELPANG